VITTLIVAAFISLFIRSTDEDKPLRKLFAVYASRLDYNGFLYKATVECLECRCLWLSVISVSFVALINMNASYLFFAPLCWVLSQWFYKIVV